jgi:nitrogen regulatory protein PII-like uncharacterized protein
LINVDENMAGPQTVPSYDKLHIEILKKLKKTAETLKKIEYEYRDVSPKELYDYLTGETPAGDITTIADVLASEYLMIHEVVETSELKKMGILLNTRTVMKFHPEIYRVHFTATEIELDYAVSRKDYDWVKARISLAPSWLEDDLMPKHLVPRCRALMAKFSRIP